MNLVVAFVWVSVLGVIVSPSILNSAHEGDTVPLYDQLPNYHHMSLIQQSRPLF
jgi:hypothetical protein